MKMATGRPGGTTVISQAICCAKRAIDRLPDRLRVTTDFVDLMQDDFSFTGVADYGYWHWKVTGMDAHDNPIYDAAGPQVIFNRLICVV